jgi:hypothetical protein
MKMKKIKIAFCIYFALNLVVSCKSKPSAEYECEGYITKKDWELTLSSAKDSILIYGINKKISLKSDFPSAKDSTKFIMELFAEQYKKLPPSNDLYQMIYKSLQKSKSACKHAGTFNPFEINTYFTEGDSTITIKVDYFASNAYKTPSELRGYFEFDSKTYEMKDENVFE